MSITLLIKIPQHFAIVIIAVIVMCISTVAIVMPQAAYASTDESDRSSSSDDDEDCGSDEVSASIDGTIECIGEGECKSYEFDGKEVKHCNSR
jgi:hypothetical protein